MEGKRGRIRLKLRLTRRIPRGNDPLLERDGIVLVPGLSRAAWAGGMRGKALGRTRPFSTPSSAGGGELSYRAAKSVGRGGLA
jgi:hypothetical protein